MDKHGPRFGVSRRADLNDSHSGSVPGPGAYNVPTVPINIPTAPKISFGSGNREDSGRRVAADVPGPGSYNIGDRVGREGSKFSIAGRLRMELSDAVKVPGPASYDVKLSGIKGGYKFCTADNSVTGSSTHIGKELSPGPGQYDVRTRYKRFKQCAPAWKYLLSLILEWVLRKEIN